MNLRELRYFIEVVKNNGFGRATETLHVTQPAISRAIKQLEDELGGELLIRESRGVRLTDRGRILLRYAENILQQENNLHIEMNDISEEITGILKVGLPPIIGAVYFPEILFTFRKRCPKVELEIVEMPTPQLEDALHSGAIEIAAAMLPMHAEGYKIQKFATDSLVMVAPRQHPLSQKSHVSIVELAREPFILFAEQFKVNELIYSAFGLHGLIPKVVGRSSNFELVTAMVRSGMGISLLPASVWQNKTASDFAAIPVSDPPLPSDVGLVRRSGDVISRGCEAWIEVSANILHFDVSPDFIL